MNEFDFAVIARNLPYLWEGLQLSLMLAAISIAAGIVLGSLLALLRMSRIALLSWGAKAYVNFFRSVPLILVIFWFYFFVPMMIGRSTGHSCLQLWPSHCLKRRITARSSGRGFRASLAAKSTPGCPLECRDGKRCATSFYRRPSGT